jgi:N-acetylglucosamine-6-phosphate deacetylase
MTLQIPGFIDLQVNGYKGVDFSDKSLTAEACANACRKLLQHGTAGFLPTIITSDEATYKRNLAVLAEIAGDAEFGGKVLGIHAEGPFLSKLPGAIGAHNPEWVKKPSLKFFDKMQKWANGHIKMVTLAAEIKGAEELTKALVKQNVVVSIGHEMASYEDMARLADAGARCITHLGNGMPNQVHRHHNQLVAGMAEDRLIGMIISDGHHLPAFVVKTIIRAKGTERLIITSDASPIAGCKPGVYQVLGNRAVLEKNGLLHNPEKKCLVGSSSTMLACINWLLGQRLLTEQETVQVGFINPLKLLKVRPASLKSQTLVNYDKRTHKFVIQKG